MGRQHAANITPRSPCGIAVLAMIDRPMTAIALNRAKMISSSMMPAAMAPEESGRWCDDPSALLLLRHLFDERPLGGVVKYRCAGTG